MRVRIRGYSYGTEVSQEFGTEVSQEFECILGVDHIIRLVDVVVKVATDVSRNAAVHILPKNP